MQEKILFCLVFFSILNGTSQVQDSISKEENIQKYTSKNGTVFTYIRPHLFDFITKFPKIIVGSVKDGGSTDNLIALSSASVATVALLPADQYLLDQSRQIGRKLCMADVAR